MLLGRSRVVFSSVIKVVGLIVFLEFSVWNKILNQNRLHASLGGPISGHAIALPVLQNNGTDSSHLRQERLEQYQRIVILPGPHKTGSTTIQNSLLRLLANHPKKAGVHPFEKWAFQVPTLHEIKVAGANETTLHIPPREHKAFSTLVYYNMGPPDINHSESPVYKLFKRGFRKAWKKGYSLVIAAEPLDYLSRVYEMNPTMTDGNQSPLHVHPNISWQRLLSCLPAKANTSTITVGIMHRTPRVSHLISAWHEVAIPGQSLLSFATKPSKPGSLRAVEHVLDSLGLADFFVQRGFPVKIIDTGGMQVSGADLFATTACHLLEVPCQTIDVMGNPTNVTGGVVDFFRNGESKTLKRANVKEDRSDRVLDQETLDAVNSMLKEYDCQYEYFTRLGQDKVQLYYGDNTFAGCRTRESSSPPYVSFPETMLAIVHFICERYPDSEHCTNQESSGI